MKSVLGCATISEWRRHSFYRGLLLVCFCLPLSACSGLLFHPQQQLVRTPAAVDLAYEDVYLTTHDNVRLHGWWLSAAPAPEVEDDRVKGTVLFLHGNAQNISSHLASVYWLPAAGYNVMLVDYRGFGQSQGEPSLPGAIKDVQTLLSWAQAHPDKVTGPVFLLGQSLGASLGGFVVGSDLRWHQGLSGVILDAGFSRYSTAAKEVANRSWLTWWLQQPVAMAMPDGYDLLDVVDNISPLPLLIIHGEQDQVIDISHARALFATAGQPKALMTYPGNHIQTFNNAGNRQLLLDFFSRASKVTGTTESW